jgi:hypothetical protein
VPTLGCRASADDICASGLYMWAINLSLKGGLKEAGSRSQCAKNELDIGSWEGRIALNETAAVIGRAF